MYVDPSSTDKVEQGLDLLPGYQWISIKLTDGTVYKVLGPDYIERSKWRTLANTADEEEGKKFRQYSEKRLAEYKAALNFSDEELQSLEYEDPSLLHDLTTPSSRVKIELLAGLNDEQTNYALSPQGLTVNVRDLPASTQKKLFDSFRKSMIEESAYKYTQLGYNPPSATELEEDFFNNGALYFSGDYGNVCLRIKSNIPMLSGCQSCVLSSKGISYSWARLALLVAKGMSWEDAHTFLEAELKYFSKLRLDVQKKVRENYSAKNPPRFGSKNAPEGKFDKEFRASCPEIIQRICKQKEYSFFAFKPRMTGGRLIKDNTPLGYALDQAADSLEDYVWAYQDGQLIFAPRHFVDRLAENIPPSTIAKLRKIALQTNSIFDFEGLVKVISLLNQKQLEALPENVPYDLMQARIYYANEPVIKFYASLNPSQRKQACNGGISCTALGDLQKDLFYKAVEGILTAPTPCSEPAEFSIIDRGSFLTEDPEGGESYFCDELSDDTENSEDYQGFPTNTPDQHHFLFRLSLADGTTQSIDLRFPVPGDKCKITQNASKSEDKPAPTQPQVLAVMKSLSEWNYIGRRTHDDDNEPKAVMSSQKGDRSVKRALKTGDTLEGARLVDFGVTSATFSLDGAQITFPLAQTTALAPFDPKTPTEETLWIDIDAAWAEAIKKEISE
ncbi:MAG: hypothetical protein ABFD46_07680 [Armatimonadota bacterium]